MTNAFVINGGKPLKGEIIPQGAKNEALQILSAVLLTSEKITVSNVPDIKDVNKLIELLGDMGVSVEIWIFSCRMLLKKKAEDYVALS
jgi:UDP-N-acetylglucosamine 1-carboxyvinyltransferase